MIADDSLFAFYVLVFLKSLMSDARQQLMYLNLVFGAHVHENTNVFCQRYTVQHGGLHERIWKSRHVPNIIILDYLKF